MLLLERIHCINIQKNVFYLVEVTTNKIGLYNYYFDTLLGIERKNIFNRKVSKNDFHSLERKEKYLFKYIKKNINKQTPNYEKKHTSAW